MIFLKRRKFASVNIDECVSCGACVKVCPVSAIHIEKGLYAHIGNSCVGCGKCSTECPASVITMIEK